MAARKCTSYTAEFKLNVIKKAEEVENQEAGCLCNIDKSNICLWRKSKEEFSQTTIYKLFWRDVSSWPELKGVIQVDHQ